MRKKVPLLVNGPLFRVDCVSFFFLVLAIVGHIKWRFIGAYIDVFGIFLAHGIIERISIYQVVYFGCYFQFFGL